MTVNSSSLQDRARSLRNEPGSCRTTPPAYVKSPDMLLAMVTVSRQQQQDKSSWGFLLRQGLFSITCDHACYLPLGSWRHGMAPRDAMQGQHMLVRQVVVGQMQCNTSAAVQSHHVESEKQRHTEGMREREPDQQPELQANRIVHSFEICRKALRFRVTEEGIAG